MAFSLILGVLFGAGVVGGLVAQGLRRKEGPETPWLCLGGTFAGGAFLAAALFDLGPESVKDLGWGLALLAGGGIFLGLRWLDQRGHHAHAEVHGHGHHTHGAGSATKPWILGGMLTFHSLLEGLALGSVSTAVAREALALAILFHKATDTFALAMTLGRWGVSSGRVLLATLLLSAASPGGAWLASRVDLSGPHLFHGILSAATAGTFLYLAGSDLLVPELKEAEGRAGKIVSAIFGFCVVAAATFLAHG